MSLSISSFHQGVRVFDSPVVNWRGYRETMRGHMGLGQRRRRAFYRRLDAWRKDGIPPPIALRVQWHTYATAAKQRDITLFRLPAGQIRSGTRFHVSDRRVR